VKNASTPSSKDRMIEAAIDLMRSYGLSGAGINDVVHLSGAPRGSLYHYFPDGKLQMAGEALAVHGERMGAFMEDALASARGGPQKVMALFDAFARRAEAADYRKSCPLGCVALDLDADTESLRPVVAHAFEAWQALIAAHFEPLGAGGAMEYAGVLLTAIEGAYVRARAQHSGEPFREAGRWLARLLKA
jgi:TetR/AcrR family transcriptional regulator, lmrAB and yxaGH operons repressor